MAQSYYTAQEAFLSLKRGEEEGFAYFFDQLYAPLHYFAIKLLDDAEAAEDLVEESFVKLWQHREGVRHPQAVKSYLYTAVRNACTDLQRKERSLAAYTGYIKRTVDAGEPQVLQRIVEAEVLRELGAALDSLPPKCGLVLRRFYLDGKALAEIAEEMQITVGTVKSQKLRALELLRKRMGSVPVVVLLCLSLLLRVVLSTAF